MRCKKNEPFDPVCGGHQVDPAYEMYMKKCMKKYPFLYKMIDYIVDCKIAALRAEMYHTGMYQPMPPGMMHPGMPCPGMAGPVMGGPMGGPPPFRPYPGMPM